MSFQIAKTGQGWLTLVTEDLWNLLFYPVFGHLSTQSEITSKAHVPSWFSQIDTFTRDLQDDELQELKKGMQTGVFEALLSPPTVKLATPPLKKDWHGISKCKFPATYGKPFVGDAASNFITYLNNVKDDDRPKPLYAKAVSVVQSSGTGKSRMLTEVGKFIFTLPICLRDKYDAGWPPSDLAVVDYFSALSGDNDLSISMHIGITCFLSAAYLTMLDCLQFAEKDCGSIDGELLKYWHEHISR